MKYIDRWTFSTSHKDMAILYLMFGFVSGMVGTAMSVMMRMELTGGNAQFLHNNNHLFNVLVTGHAIAMMFLFVMPVLIGAFGNFYLPMMMGAVDMAFARLNNMSFWTLPPALVCMMASVLIENGAGTGWTVYPPLSSMGSHSGPSVDLAMFALHLTSMSSLLGAMNFMVTFLNMRTMGLHMMNSPLYVWAVFFTAMLLLLSLPVLTAGVTLLLMDRNFNTGFYEVGAGGDPVLYQHLFYMMYYLLSKQYENMSTTMGWGMLMMLMYYLIKFNLFYFFYYNLISLKNKDNQFMKKLVLNKTSTNMNMNYKNFDFLEFYNLYKKFYPRNELPNSKFLEWFIGFFEGEGNFSVMERGDLAIRVTQKDKEMLKYMQKEFGFGSVMAQNKEKSMYKWVMTKKREMYMMCLLLNGNLVLPIRYIKFSEFMAKLNIKLVKNNEEILTLKNYCKLPTLKDNWLLGFTDGEGCFTCSMTNNGTMAYRVRFILTQKYEANKYVLEHMLNLFNMHNKTKKTLGMVLPHSASDCWEMRFNGLKNCKKMLFYFDENKLLTKSNSYNKWKEMLNKMENGDHKDPMKRLELIKLSKLVNISQPSVGDKPNIDKMMNNSVEIGTKDKV
ncbi:putative LAGLIDADG endonuclease (mitochondrion) [[Candida] anglica]|uniref:LAGLIDADG endonuclease n=1 Tax=[Candida] anglica TaxID=148631 RepID=A0ABP0EMA3_9ASCO